MDTGPELGMKTTGGTLALTEAEPARNAMIVDMVSALATNIVTLR
jgi:hypothetical protein